MKLVTTRLLRALLCCKPFCYYDICGDIVTDKKRSALVKNTKGLKTLFDLGLPRLSLEEQEAFEAERVRAGKAQADAWHKWGDDEIEKFVDAFKSQCPAQYSNYIQQEKDVDTGKIDKLDIELALEMQRFSKLSFPDVTPIDRTNLFIAVRRHVRSSLNLSRP